MEIQSCEGPMLDSKSTEEGHFPVHKDFSTFLKVALLLATQQISHLERANKNESHTRKSEIRVGRP